MEIQEFRACSSVFEFLRTLRNRLLLLAFLEGAAEPVLAGNAFSSPEANGLRSKRRVEKEAMDNLLSVDSAERGAVLETSIDMALLWPRCCLERKIPKAPGWWMGEGASFSVSLLSDVVE